MTGGSRQHLILAGPIVFPLVFYVVLRLFPALDPTWSGQFFHFYIVSFTSLVAFVLAGFILLRIHYNTTESLFAGIGFMALAGIFLLHGISTPGVIIPGFNLVVGWSARLSLPIGAFFIALSMIRFPENRQRQILRYRNRLWLLLTIVYGLYILIAFKYSTPLQWLEQFPYGSDLLAGLSIALYLWGTWGAWQRYRQSQARLPFVLVIGLPWLAIAQFSQYEAPTWALSWWLYHILMLGAFTVTMIALVMDYEEVRAFRLNHYFIMLGILASVVLVAFLSEVIVHLTGAESLRWHIFVLILIAVEVFLMILLIVVSRGQSILDERHAALELQRQWRTDMTNLIVHDLKSPITSIFLNIDLILSERQGVLLPGQHKLLTRVQASASDMSELITNLLDIEKFEVEGLQTNRSACNLNDLLRSAIDAVQELADASTITLTQRLPDVAPIIHVDEQLLRRIMQNLLTNAIKFTPEKGQVHVEAMVANAVTIIVEDSGIGVPVEDRKRIFEKFGQVQGHGRHGYGLGLAFCKLAVEAHGGQIHVEDASGGGSRFVLWLPEK